jgi:hypothetical protein
MSYAQLEEQLAALGRRIDSIERRLGPADQPAIRAISFDQAVRLLGWVIAGGSLLVFLISWWIASVPAWALAVPVLLGLWLALREHPFFDVSDSTLLLLQEERATHGRHAASVHKRHTLTSEGGALHSERALATFGMGVGMLILAVLVGWGIIYLVPTQSGQVLVFSAILLCLLAYSLSAGLEAISLLVSGGLYLLLLALGSPLLGLFLTAALSVWLGFRAFRRHDWNLALLTLAGTYLMLARWTFDAYDLSVASHAAVAVITAEMLLLAAITFALPLSGLRRTAEERVKVRWIICLNTFGYTSLSIPLVRELVPGNWAPYVTTLLFTGLALAGLAWQAHGRLSYAKYFVLASAAGFLIASLLFLDPSLVTLVWLMGSIVLLTVGFAAGSYTFRLAGLLALLATVLRYLGITLATVGPASPVFFLRDRIWIGLLLAIFLIITGFWYRDLRSRGAEEKYRLGIAAILYSLAALVVCGLVAVEAMSLPH